MHPKTKMAHIINESIELTKILGASRLTSAKNNSIKKK
jgi:hypothetical protein